MKNFVGVLFITFILTGCSPGIELFSTARPTNIGIKTGFCYGTIFTQDYVLNNSDIPATDITKRFTPTKEEAVSALRILSQEIQNQNKLRHNENSPYHAMEKNIRKYFFQYVGYINPNGEKVIHINFLWNRFSSKQQPKLNYESDYQVVLDGGNHYWQVTINLSTQTVTNFHVNGIA